MVSGNDVYSAISSLASVFQSITTPLDGIDPPIATLDLNSQKISNLLPGVASTDAATVG